MQENAAKIPLWFWGAAGLALAWNLIGVMSFISTVTMSPESLAEMPAAEQALYENAPYWSSIAFAVGVFGGIFGSLLLLLRKNLAMTFFVASLIGVIVQFSYWLFMTDAISVYGATHAFMMPALVTIIAAALIWFAKMARGKGWLA